MYDKRILMANNLRVNYFMYVKDKEKYALDTWHFACFYLLLNSPFKSLIKIISGIKASKRIF